jgi:D-alanyl-D-alanine-carboxypeptidase/D-alanyl-D-alanine-endopeptidase
MWRTIITSTGLALLTTACLRAQDQVPGESEIKQILRDCVAEQKRAPGIVVGLVDTHGSKVVSFGKFSGDSVNAVNGDTVFEIGSVSKTFTALLLAKMVERGEVNLDDPANKFLPEPAKLPSWNDQPITLRHLATHTSGLPRLPNNLQSRDPGNPYAGYTVEQMYAFLARCKLKSTPGEKYAYSNLGAGLLGHVLSLKSGTNYEGLLLNEICEPLKMKDTCITLSAEMKTRLAPGHNSAGVQVKNWDIPTLAGAGAIRSTANDMVKYVGANLGLIASSLAKTMEKTHVSRHEAGAPDMEIGLGWHVRKSFGSAFIWHNGGTGGYHSFVGFDKRRKRGVVVLANAETEVDDLGWHLLDQRFDLKEVHARQVAKIDSRVYDDYVGTYKFPLGGAFVITRNGDHLFAKLASQPTIEVYPESETKFFYTILDAQLSFLKDKSGAVTHLVLHQNGVDQKAAKAR